MNLLTREEFKKQVFRRDKNCCVVCGEFAVDAHHLIERKLWDNGGYYLNNGVSLCEACHIKAESTEYSVEYLRKCADITTIVIPPHFDCVAIDKWGFRLTLEDEI